MQVELIAPAGEDSAFIPRLGLGILAAHTPPTVQIHYHDEILRPFDLERDLKEVDLVGISVDSKTAHRSYQIASAYRQRGVKVVLGGIHVTALPEEGLEHADAVVIGEAEEVWPQVIQDMQDGHLRPTYRGGLPELGGRPFARRDLFRSKKYIPFQVVQTMRGCPYPCEFCSVSTANGTSLRFRPGAEVIAELQTLGKFILFADDNVMLHHQRSKALFSELGRMGKRWIGQCSLAALEKRGNIELMAQSGCIGLFIGFESIDEHTLRATGKQQNKPARYRDIVARLHAHGIGTWGSFVFGFDSDDQEVFDRTVEFAIEARLTMALFAILTPYPGTRLYQRLRAAGRLTDDHWWLREDHDAGSPYFVPARMSREQLREGWKRAWERFYAARSIWHRWRVPSAGGWMQSLAYLPLNLLQNRLTQHKILGGQPRFRSHSPSR